MINLLNNPIIHKFYKNEKWNVSKFGIFKYNECESHLCKKKGIRMEKSVEILFTEDILTCFLESFHLHTEVKKLGDFENYVFEAYRGNNPVILRITHNSHRSKDEILAELDWMNYLHNKR
jgi:hypothetical protein